MAPPKDNPDTPTPSRNDPTPEARKEDASFLPVVVASAVAIIVILIAAIVFIRMRQSKAVPTAPDHHPTSQLYQPPPARAA